MRFRVHDTRPQARLCIAAHCHKIINTAARNGSRYQKIPRLARARKRHKKLDRMNRLSSQCHAARRRSLEIVLLRELKDWRCIRTWKRKGNIRIIYRKGCHQVRLLITRIRRLKSNNDNKIELGIVSETQPLISCSQQ